MSDTPSTDASPPTLAECQQWAALLLRQAAECGPAAPAVSSWAVEMAMAWIALAGTFLAGQGMDPTIRIDRHFKMGNAP